MLSEVHVVLPIHKFSLVTNIRPISDHPAQKSMVKMMILLLFGFPTKNN